MNNNKKTSAVKKKGILSRMFSDMDKGALTSTDMRKPSYRILYFAMVLVMLLYMAVVFVPCIWMLLSGFKDVGEMYAKPARFFPKQIQLSKLKDAWSQLRFYRYYVNTFVMALGCVIGDVVVSGLAGYVISRLKPRGSKVFMAIVFSLMLLPATMSTVPLYMTFKDFPIFHINMLDTYWPIWLMAAANMFNIILFKTAFDGISNSLVEAARIDGANNLHIFFKIIIPLSIPVIVTVAIFDFNNQFGTFFWPYLLISDPDKSVIGTQLYKARQSNLTMDYQMLTILFSIAPQVLVFALFQKYIMGGINVGGVKG